MTGRVIDTREFDELFDAAARLIVRVETRSHYSVDTEDEDFGAWQRGIARPPRSVRTDPYLSEVAASVARGVAWQRLRLLSAPLSTYERWELEVYRENAVVGESISVIARPEAGAADFGDVYMFDDRDVVIMNYRADGSLSELTAHAHDSLTARRCRDTVDALRAIATPLHDYLATGEALRAS